MQPHSGLRGPVLELGRDKFSIRPQLRRLSLLRFQRRSEAADDRTPPRNTTEPRVGNI